MEGKVEYKVKAKYKQPFDTFGCVLWIVFLNIIGLIIAAFLCKEKYYIIIESIDIDNYKIKKIQVEEMELYKVDLNELVVEEKNYTNEGTKTEYWVVKEAKQIKIKTI